MIKEILSIIIQWIVENKSPLIVTGIGIVLTFISLGLTGIVFYGPATMFYKVLGMESTLEKMHGDSTWPILLSVSFLACILIVPMHYFVNWVFPNLIGWKHVMVVGLMIWVLVVSINILAIYQCTRK